MLNGEIISCSRRQYIAAVEMAFSRFRMGFIREPYAEVVRLWLS